MSGKGFFQPTKRKSDRKPLPSQPPTSADAAIHNPAIASSSRVILSSAPPPAPTTPFSTTPSASAPVPRPPLLRSKPVSADLRPPTRNQEWVPIGIFKDVLDLVHSADANVFPDHSKRFLRRLFYLMSRRPQDADRLISECNGIYEARYSRSRRSRARPELSGGPVPPNPPAQRPLQATHVQAPSQATYVQASPQATHVRIPPQAPPSQVLTQTSDVQATPHASHLQTARHVPQVQAAPQIESQSPNVHRRPQTANAQVTPQVQLPPQTAPTPPTPLRSQARAHSSTLQAPTKTIDLTQARRPTAYDSRPNGTPSFNLQSSGIPVIDVDSITPVMKDNHTSDRANAKVPLRNASVPILIKEGPPTPPLPPTQPAASLPVIETRLFGDRGRIMSHVKSRWDAYLAGIGKPRNQRTVDGGNYVVWEDGDEQVLLEVATCTNLVGLQDGEGALDSIHFDILRFLWLCLVKDRCAGAVLNHGVGFPRTHLTLVFCRLAQKYGGEAAKKIAVFCPSSTEKQWMYAHTACYSDHVHFATKETWSDSMKKWNDHGGILVCSFDVLLVIVKSSDCDAKSKAYEGLWRPGPDITIVDEAARLDECDEVLQRFLRKSRSKARLALTSSPFGGHLLRQWRIFNWAAPALLGSMEEYWQVFIRHLVNNSNASSDIALHLSRMTEMIAFKLNLETRLQALKRKGRSIRENSIVVHLDDGHNAVYKATASYLEKAIMQGLSKFVAVYLLLTAATSTRALLALVEEWDQNTEVPDKMYRSVDRAKGHFLQLKTKIRSLVRPTSKSTKITLAVSMCRKWITEKKRPAIFTTIPEVTRELHRELQQAFSESFYRYDLNSNSQDRYKQLEKFNTSEGGAVLLAPYGSVLDCVEDGDWGFVNATHVLVIDSCWDPSALSQAVNRVHSFAVISDVVYVYHLIASGTAEMNIQTRIEQIMSGRQCSGKRLPVLPFITDDIFKEPESLQQESEKDQDEELVVHLRALGGNASVLPHPGRYTMSSCLLEAGFDRGDPTIDDNAEYFVAKERGAYLGTHSSLMKAIEKSTRMADRYRTWRDTGALKVKALLFSPQMYRSNSLLSSWHEYFRLYEQQEVRKDLASELKKLEEAVIMDPNAKSEPQPFRNGPPSTSRKRKRESGGKGPTEDGFRQRYLGGRGPQY